MQKRIVPIAQKQSLSVPDDHWLDLEQLAEVELSSEDPAHPIESAFQSVPGLGWRADQAGEQTIRIIFTNNQQIRRIWLEFVELSTERTQQFVLRWSEDGGNSFHEIVRQQWNFSPGGATHQTEDYHVDLSGVDALELNIIPDTSGGDALASLARMCIA